MSRKKWLVLALSLLVITGSTLVVLFLLRTQPQSVSFSGDSTYQIVLDQMKFGPRIPGSLAHQLAQQYIINKLEASKWDVEMQSVTFEGHQINNIIARKGKSGSITILGAHYDSRLYASEDSNQLSQSLPVPGANDGASGVAVLLELARTLPQPENNQIWLVFFDAEDQGRIEGWDWILGSKAFVQNLTVHPDRVVILDMIGDSDLNIYREKGSDPTLTDQIWNSAKQIGLQDFFINEPKYTILDDHLPFIEAGIPAVDIIDFDYPYWHTVDDTSDKVSPKSLEIVGLTISQWLQDQP